MTYFFSLTTAVAVILMIATLQAMLGGTWRRFPLLFLYLILSLVAAAVVGTAYFSAGAKYTDVTTVAYWVLHVLAQVTGLTMVVTLTWQATENPEKARRTVRWMIFAILLTIIFSALWNEPSRIRGIGSYSRWLAFVSRDIDFLTALLNMVLWTSLIANRRRDKLVLMISAGFGIQSAGEAIGWALRFFGNDLLQNVGSNLMFAVAGVTTAYIWFRAMRLGAATAATAKVSSPQILL